MNTLTQQDLADRLESAIRHSNENDQNYAESYAVEGTMWDVNQIYDSIATLVPALPEGGIHVDLGCAMATLAAKIKQANPEGIVAGVDRNTFLLALAASQTKERGVPTQIHHREVRLIDETKRVRSRFLGIAAYNRILAGEEEAGNIAFPIKSRSLMDQVEEDDDQFLEIDPALRLVVDDIRNLELLQALLKGRQVDSVSFSFPGGSSRYAYEAPHIAPFAGVKVHSSAEAPRVNQGILDTMQAAIQFASNHLKPDGTLVIANRFPYQLAQQHADKRDVELPILMGEQTYRQLGIDTSQFDLTNIMLTTPFTIPRLPKNLPSITSWGTPSQKGRKSRKVRQADQSNEEIGIAMFQFKKER